MPLDAPSSPSSLCTLGWRDSTFKRLAGAIGAAVPAQCAVCRAWPAQPVCQACIARFAQPKPRCLRCALPVPEAVDLCGRCLHTPPPLDACHARVSYGFPWSALIAQFKFQGQAGWARVFAALMQQAPGMRHALERADLVLPMPLSPQRLAERGFNQAWALARALATSRSDGRLLLRVKDTQSQASLDRAERLRNVKDAFALEPLTASRVSGKHVVLVDDVMTSGASLFCAAQVLRAARAASITALVLARTDEDHHLSSTQAQHSQ